MVKWNDATNYRAGGIGPAGPILAGPFLHFQDAENLPAKSHYTIFYLD